MVRALTEGKSVSLDESPKPGVRGFEAGASFCTRDCILAVFVCVRCCVTHRQFQQQVASFGILNILAQLADHACESSESLQAIAAPRGETGPEKSWFSPRGVAFGNDPPQSSRLLFSLSLVLVLEDS